MPSNPLLTHNISPLPAPVAPQTRLAGPRLGADSLSHPPCGHITPIHHLPGLKMTLNDKTHLFQGLLVSSWPHLSPPCRVFGTLHIALL